MHANNIALQLEIERFEPQAYRKTYTCIYIYIYIFTRVYTYTRIISHHRLRLARPGFSNTIPRASMVSYMPSR